MKRNRKINNALSMVVLVLVGIYFLFPFFCMIAKSFMTEDELYLLTFLPERIQFGSYAEILDADFFRYFLNTMKVIILTATGTVVSSFICAYGFAKVEFKHKNVYFAAMMATMLLPTIITQLPSYVLFSKMGWTGTILPLVVPAWFGGGALNVFLEMQFIKGIPNDLLSSAKIDGAGHIRIMTSILAPLCKPILLLVAVNTFLNCWNEYTGAMIFIGNVEESYTLSLALFYKAAMNHFTENMYMAWGVLMIIPCMILFSLFQTQLLDGVTLTGIKG